MLRPYPSYSVVLLVTFCLILLGLPALGGKFNRQISVGDAAPVWKGLIGVDDRRHSLGDYKANVLVVVFIANHCPVAAAYEERMKTLATDYRSRGVEFVAISVSQLDTDRLDKMKERAQDSKLPFPYLHDASQESGRLYGATTTPQIFVLNAERRITYMGAFDDNWRDASKVETPYARDAIDAVLAGRTPEIRETRPVGCVIEYADDAKKEAP